MPHLDCGKYRLSLNRPLIMGILNVTPDSFSDGGRYSSVAAATDHARRLIDEGADLIDIGGESTRPGADPVSLELELERVIPVVAAASRLGVPISVDTQKPEVMRQAIAAGASMVNDINALEGESLTVAAASEVAVCLMHKQGDPLTMQRQPQYFDVVAEVAEYLAGRIAAAEGAGIGRSRIVIDPGFGFGKNLEQNLALLRDLSRFADLRAPILVGISRKSMLGQITGRAVHERGYASVAAALIAVQRKASIVRVHDVAATCDALMLWNRVEERES